MNKLKEIQDAINSLRLVPDVPDVFPLTLDLLTAIVSEVERVDNRLDQVEATAREAVNFKPNYDP